MKDIKIKENIIKKAMSINHRSIVNMIPTNFFDPTVKVIFYDPLNAKCDKEYFKEKNK